MSATKMLWGMVGPFAALVIGIAAFYYGYTSGYVASSAANAASMGIEAVANLRALRENNSAAPIALLEAQVDASLIQYLASINQPRPRIFSGGRDAERSLMRAIAQYRSEFPSQAPIAEVRAKVAEAAEKLK
jgi:hypothetical protein